MKITISAHCGQKGCKGVFRGPVGRGTTVVVGSCQHTIDVADEVRRSFRDADRQIERGPRRRRR